MVSNKDREKFKKELVDILALASEDKKILASFLEDLLTPAEFDEIAGRWQIVKLLGKGMPHHQIAKRAHAGVATVTRGAQEMKNPQGGFRTMLKKFNIYA